MIINCDKIWLTLENAKCCSISKIAIPGVFYMILHLVISLISFLKRGSKYLRLIV